MIQIQRSKFSIEHKRLMIRKKETRSLIKNMK